MSYRISAVHSLFPKVHHYNGHNFYDINGGLINFSDDEEKQIKVKEAELQAEYDAKDYARKREAEYPSIQECVHAILDDQLDALQAKRAEIKTKYPKG